jgi:flagellar hook assembly protein FlgD
MNAGVRFVNWDGRMNNGMPAGSGIYIYYVLTNKGILNGKMVLLK